MACSKQEVSRQVKRAENNDWITLKSNPLDARAKIVCFSDNGLNKLKSGQQYYQAIEQQWCQSLGEDKISQLKQLLNDLESVFKT